MHMRGEEDTFPVPHREREHRISFAVYVIVGGLNILDWLIRKEIMRSLPPVGP